MPPSPDDPDLAWLLALIEGTEDLALRSGGDPPREGDGLSSRGVDSIGRVCLLYAIVDALAAADVDESVVTAWDTLGDVLAFARDLRDLRGR